MQCRQACCLCRQNSPALFLRTFFPCRDSLLTLGIIAPSNVKNHFGPHLFSYPEDCLPCVSMAFFVGEYLFQHKPCCRGGLFFGPPPRTISIGFCTGVPPRYTILSASSSACLISSMEVFLNISITAGLSRPSAS